MAVTTAGARAVSHGEGKIDAVNAGAGPRKLECHQARAAPEIKRGAEPHVAASQRTGPRHGRLQDRRAALGEIADQMLLEPRGILIKQAAHIGVGRTRGVFAAQPREPQGGTLGILGVARECAQKRGLRCLDIAQRCARIAKRIPGRSPTRCNFKRLFAKIGGGSMITIARSAARVIIAAVGGGTSGRAGELGHGMDKR